MNNIDSLSPRLREPASHLTRWFNSALLFTLLTVGVAGCSDQPIAETGGRLGRAPIDLTVPEGVAVPLGGNRCAVTGSRFAAILENISPDSCTRFLISAGGTEVDPDAIREAQQALRKKLQDEAQKLIDDTAHVQEQRAEVAIALANVPTPTPTPAPVRSQVAPTPAEPIPGDKEFKSKFFKAPIPTETPSPEKLAAQAALEAAFARGPEIGFGPPPTPNAQADSTKPTLGSQSEPIPTAQPVAESSAQLQDPLSPATETVEAKPLTAFFEIVSGVVSEVLATDPVPIADGLKTADSIVATSPPTNLATDLATDLDTEQPSVDVQSDGAGWADIFLSPEFAIPVIFCVVIPGSLMGIFGIYWSKSQASNEEILQNGMKKLSGKK